MRRARSSGMGRREGARIAPTKILHRSSPDAPAVDRHRRARRRRSGACSSSSACSTASIAVTTTCSASFGRPPRRARARPAVITFDHHPDEILTGAAPPLLCDPDERLERLGGRGRRRHRRPDLRRCTRRRRTTPSSAASPIASSSLGFLMTPESAFGYERRGTPETVAALGLDLGFDVEVVPQFTLDGEPVRSSDIRAAIAAGDLVRAERLLGRPYSSRGSSSSPGSRGSPRSERLCLPRCRLPASTKSSAMESLLAWVLPSLSRRSSTARAGSGWPADRRARAAFGSSLPARAEARIGRRRGPMRRGLTPIRPDQAQAPRIAQETCRIGPRARPFRPADDCNWVPGANGRRDGPQSRPAGTT